MNLGQTWPAHRSIEITLAITIMEPLRPIEHVRPWPDLLFTAGCTILRREPTFDRDSIYLY